MGCGCSGSTPPKNPRRTVAQAASPSQVPGGPGTPGYTWDGPKRAARSAAADSGSKKK